MAVDSVVTAQFAAMAIKAKTGSKQAELDALKRTQKVRRIIERGRAAFVESRALTDLRKDRIVEAQTYRNDWGPPYNAVALMLDAVMVAEPKPAWGFDVDPEAYVCGFKFETHQAGVLAMYVESPRKVLVFDWLGGLGAWTREQKKFAKRPGFEGFYARAQACLRS